jgi:hypothetical protein
MEVGGTRPANNAGQQAETLAHEKYRKLGASPDRSPHIIIPRNPILVEAETLFESSSFHLT